jgi:hypothetical protein
MRPGVGLLAACDDPALFGFPLWPRQRDLLAAVEAGPRLQVWALGRRSGKTTLAALAALWDCLLRPELDALVRPGERRHAVAAATNMRQARLFVAAARSVVEASPLLAEMVEGSTEDEITFVNGTAVSAFPCSVAGCARLADLVPAHGRGCPLHLGDGRPGCCRARVRLPRALDGPVRRCRPSDRRLDAMEFLGPVRGSVSAGDVGRAARRGRREGDHG